jgi:hypothetical protein
MQLSFLRHHQNGDGISLPLTNALEEHSILLRTITVEENLSE